MATNDVHYLDKEDAEAHDVTVHPDGKLLNDPKRMRFPFDEFYLKSGTGDAGDFAHLPEAIENTNRIARRCNVTIEFHKLPFAEVSAARGRGSRGLSQSQDPCGHQEALRGPSVRSCPLADEKRTRCHPFHGLYGLFSHRVGILSVLQNRRGFPVGRGAAVSAGSIVSYALDIMELDPLAYDLFLRAVFESRAREHAGYRY